MGTYDIDQLAKFLVRLNVNGHLADDALNGLVEALGDASRGYGPGASNGQPPLPATVKVINEADATIATNLYDSLTEEICVLIAITYGPNTGGTDGIDDMNPILIAAVEDGYIDANAIDYPALKEELKGPTDTDRPDIAADPDK